MKSSIFKYSILGGIGSLILSIILLWVSGYFAQKWYAESVKTKEEIRNQIFQEMRSKGKDFYENEYVNQLKLNTEIINKWMEKNPKEADKLLIFKEGYEAK